MDDKFTKGLIDGEHVPRMRRPYRALGLLWVTNCHKTDIVKYRSMSKFVLYENRPRPTEQYSVEQLESMGYRGLWRKDPRPPRKPSHFAKLARLRSQANRLGRLRKHNLVWEDYFECRWGTGLGQTGTCSKCGKLLQILTSTRPNEIDLGGDAVLTCTNEY